MKLRTALLVLGLVPLLVYVGFASTWVVQQNQEGVRLRFGRAVGTVGGGLHVTMPYPIERIVSVPTTEVRVVPIGVAVQEGVTRIRGLGEDGSQWMTGDTNIVELRANVLYTVTDPVAYLYGTTSSGTVESHEDLLRAVSESVLTRLVASTTIDSALATGKTELSRRGRLEIQALLDELGAGVHLSALNISEVNPPVLVIGAFNDVSTAKADRERRLAEAEGLQGTVMPSAQAQAREVVQEAHTYAHDLTSRARGEAESFTKLATEVAKSPRASRERLWLDAIERILEVTDERVVPTGSRVYVGG